MSLGTRVVGGETRSRVSISDLAFFGFFAVYTFGALAVLSIGAGAVVSAKVESLHATLHVFGLGTGPVSRAALRMADASHHLHPPIQIAIDYAFSLVNIGLAGLLLWLRPWDRTARLLALGFVGTAGMFNLTAQSAFEIIPLDTFETAVQAVAHVAAGLAYAYALVLFPDGRRVPSGSNAVQGFLYLPVALAAAFLVLRAEGTARPGSLIVFFGLVVPLVGVASQAYRFRRSLSPQEHQQARLLFLALVPALGLGLFYVANQGLPLNTSEVLAGRGLGELPIVAFRLFQPVFAIIPLALFAGLVHYRLWDIDRVINRTLVYTLLTATLGGAYVGMVVLLQRLLSPLTQGADVAVAASTLATVAAFGPVRRRIQTFVDRRFNRRKYDAARTIEAFSGRLRDQIDLDTLTFELGAVAAETMEPAHVSFWVRTEDSGLHRAWVRHPKAAWRGRTGGTPR